ncbi:hypothetical protein P9314_09735 [Paenibacillus validus]|uniref:Uncharacterized protein n=1 Tax=Paenibacillus validus TaxID=44253 RepID=A0A7X2Z7K2_9BACL|nr:MULTISPECIES: hypothetical protein [Paenibacillus]MED4600980.1 hypothetical protein [Paenibacillus validus]MED4604973.1 hypothetical protein [Paenibacillus validus]MUG69756.1 hypothetical protein [Paenibacillus validus]
MHCPKCPASQIFDPPRVIFQDFFHPQVVEIVHPIEIVNRHHCVPVPHHVFTFTVKDEFCPSPGIGPGPLGVAAAQVKTRKKKAPK